MKTNNIYKDPWALNLSIETRINDIYEIEAMILAFNDKIGRMPLEFNYDIDLIMAELAQIETNLINEKVPANLYVKEY